MKDQKNFPIYEGYPPLAELPGKNLYQDAIREAERDGAKVNARPMYFYKEGKEQVGVLMLHGYTAGPLQMLELAKMFYDNDMAVYIPRLEGHGTTPEDLRRVHRFEWVRDAELAFQFLRSRCDKIYVVGFSLGGTLAYLLASRYQDIAGVITHGAIFKVAHWGAHILRAIESVLERFDLDLGMPKIPVDPTTLQFAYEIYPTRSTYQILELIDYVRPRLKRIKCPVMIIQSPKDNVVHRDSVKIISKKIASEKKEIIWYGDEHVSLVHPQPEMYQKILNFINN